jgi:hypothetical protein
LFVRFIAVGGEAVGLKPNPNFLGGDKPDELGEGSQE